jgi:hypothetical protein
MNAYASSNDRFSRCVEEFVETAGAEIRQAAAYVDRVIVPEVRRETGAAARTLARHLERLADRLHPTPQSDWPNGKQRL